MVHLEGRPQGGDVGMLEAGHELDLAQESFGEVGRCRRVVEHHFHGFDAVRNHVPDLEDSAHASAPQQADDLVAAHRLANFNAHLL